MQKKKKENTSAKRNETHKAQKMKEILEIFLSSIILQFPT